jgi:hypothetical protein
MNLESLQHLVRNGRPNKPTNFSLFLSSAFFVFSAVAKPGEITAKNTKSAKILLL